MRLSFFNVCDDIVEWKTIGTFCRVEAEAFERSLQKHGMSTLIFAHWRHWSTETDMPGKVAELAEEMESCGMVYDSDKKRNDERLQIAAADILVAWQELQEAFRNATSMGDSHLTLDVYYYDSEDEVDGIREGGDEDGAIFGVAGAYQLTPAGNNFATLCSKANVCGLR